MLVRALNTGGLRLEEAKAETMAEAMAVLNKGRTRVSSAKE